MLLGVDGGGTKTDVIVADLDGHPVATARVGCTNHESVGLVSAMTELHRGVQQALTDAGVSPRDVVAAAFGLAGVDWPSDERAIDTALDGFGLGGVRTVVNDSIVSLRAGSSSGWGIVSSVGTGAVTAGVNSVGMRYRTMSVGWGEPCGSSSLVADALHAVAAQHHRTGPPTVLTDRFLEALGLVDVLSLFEGISRRTLRADGRLAPLLQQAADHGDRVAIDVLDRSGGQHAAMVVGAADHLSIRDHHFELVTAGGVHHAGGRFVEAFVAHIGAHCPLAAIVPLVEPPVTGAVLLALDLTRSRRG